MEDLEVKDIPKKEQWLCFPPSSDPAIGSGLLLTFYPHKFLNKLKHILVRLIGKTFENNF